MLSRYIENILKILAIVIKKKRSKIKTMVTVNFRKNKVGRNIIIQ